MKVVIIGGVAGGATAAARLRRLDEEAEIIVLERSGYVSYANCGLPYYLGGVIREKEKLTLQTPGSFRSRFNIDVRVREEAVAIHRAKKEVTVERLEDGSRYTEGYDKLILSPGARPIRPPMPGIGLPGVFTLRTVEDTFAIREFMDEKKPRRAVVVGGGFIGLEAAENLLHAGLAVTLLQKDDQVLLPLDRDMAAGIHGYLRRKGLDLRLGQTVEGFEPMAGGGIRTLLAGAEGVDADFVIFAIGVSPDTALAREAGLELGARGSIRVDDRMRTSDPDIYAVGDAVEIKNFVTGQPGLISLAGPANKEGRIAADNICGRPSVYRGGQGSSVIRLFDMTAASTGLNERAAQAAGVPYDRAVTYSASHATYYPGASNMTIKTLFDPESGRILGAQIVGFEGVDKRIDVLASAIRAEMTAWDLQELDLAYAPPYSSAKDPVNMAGYVIGNVLDGLVKQFHWDEVDSLPRDGSVTLLDVRTPEEFAQGHIDGAVNIPVDELRQRLGELDPAKTVYVNCHSGLRSYIACRVLAGRGFDCRNLSGGWRYYSQVACDLAFDGDPRHPCGIPLGR